MMILKWKETKRKRKTGRISERKKETDKLTYKEREIKIKIINEK